MAQGLQLYGANGLLQFDTADNLGRMGYVGPCTVVPNQVWTQVVDPAYAGRLWGVTIPNYAIDVTDSHQLYYKLAKVSIDPVNHPGCIFVSGNWTDTNTGTVTDYPYRNCTLIWGVY